ncbi:DUF4348 domain-containing protein [Aureibaculum algae]|uniref:DUF4348 domain-containing protein n=1 Tax=Aureibaculum algae TaxID=2584122 RepID=A0A5B7TN37_9FLAO|nr:DUF4348 domain-containing protein [Aureibaculum algae]QCX37738.1 DUF4348 domain-containing protein [Aureibaculum algae]
MKQIAFILFLIFISCKNESKTEPQNKKSTETNSLKNSNNIIIPADVDLAFETFFEYFNKDSLFQVSRIDFPLKIMELDSENDYADVEKLIDLQSYRMLNLKYDSSFEKRAYDKYTQETLLNGNSAIVKMRGIDNGIYTDYEFKKSDGQWKLETWKDSST